MSDQSSLSPPAITTPPSTVLTSPPDSQSTMPPSVVANSNGKRPHTDISNGEDATPAPPRPNADFAMRTHTASGYSWDRVEDEPGFSWRSKKAVDEMQRTWEGLAHKDSVVKARYGDPIAVAEKERAMMQGVK